MHIESVHVEGFRCFGPEGVTVSLESAVTVLVGGNSTGKTALIHALLRMFGLTQSERRVVPGDFHVPADEEAAPVDRSLVVEVVVAFPELLDDGGANEDAAAVARSTVPPVFRYMTGDESGELRCRLRLEATWRDDGSVEGDVAERRVFVTDADEADDGGGVVEVSAVAWSPIRLVYVPAQRGRTDHLAALLQRRLRLSRWSDEMITALKEGAEGVAAALKAEGAVGAVEGALQRRWADLSAGQTVDKEVRLRPLSGDVSDLLRRIELRTSPSEDGRDRPADELSDGQRSLLHVALTAALVDVEGGLRSGGLVEHFTERVEVPSLTVVAVEEPENSLSPFLLGRLAGLVEEIAGGPAGQALMASHSPSIVSRVQPSALRHFRLLAPRSAAVRSVSLPEEVEAQAKYLIEAVRRHPELYFASFVVLGEGASEAAVLPILADALGHHLEHAQVAVVPLGGRHVNYLWQLLDELAIPHATLLDLDRGRTHGGAARVRYIVDQLAALGRATDIETDGKDLNDPGVQDELAAQLRGHGVFLSSPLDLDWSLLSAYPHAYTALEDGEQGPSDASAVSAVFGEGVVPDGVDEDLLRWYRYRFLTRSKPATHLRVLPDIAPSVLAAQMPEELRGLIEYAVAAMAGASDAA